MADLHRDGRIGSASDLTKKFTAVSKVSSDQRVAIIHDQIMEAIDDICTKRRENGPAFFTTKQILAIKDVAFLVVYTLDKKNHPPTGWWRRSFHEFIDAGLATKLTILIGVITLSGLLIAGMNSGVNLVSGLIEKTPDRLVMDGSDKKDSATSTTIEKTNRQPTEPNSVAGSAKTIPGSN